MCGLSGIYHRDGSPIDETALARMTAALAHRGPDDVGYAVFETRETRATVRHRLETREPPLRPDLGLGHRRLSIIDLSSAGHQPMSNEDGTVWVVYNGEIYNFKALRDELEALGHRFRSRTDTEVIPHAYEAWGMDCLKRLNGIFAFALWDVRARRLVLARDHLGVKPLYYYADPARILFASEAKALFQHGAIRPALDLSALHAYLSFLWVPEPGTMFQGVAKVPPGHYLEVSADTMTLHPYWDLAFHEPAETSEMDWILRVRSTLTDAVNRQLVSDVPLGIFLSGGLDSSGILASIAPEARAKVTAYTIGFRERDQATERQPDDLTYARQVARQFGVRHREIIIEPKIVELLPKVIRHLDDPIADPAALTSDLICEAAGHETRVLLSGQGGDEVFAGYPWHLAGTLSRLYERLPAAVRAGLIEPGIQALPVAGSPTRRRLKRFMKSASLPWRERYIGFCSYLTEAEKQALYTDPLRATLAASDGRSVHLAHLDRVAGLDPINQMLYLDTKTFLPSLNLMYTDKTSMAHAVEVRVPLLDRELVELVATAPPGLKLKGLTRKYLLKKALEDRLPRDIITRRKGGFGVPLRTWLAHDLQPMMGDLLAETTVRRRGYFRPAEVQRLMDENRSGTEDRSLYLYALMTFELWHQAFVDHVQ